MSIQIAGPSPMVIDPTDTKRRPALTVDEARVLTAEIMQTTSRLWLLVTEAHDREAHIVLGYTAWDDYVRAELSISPARSYQLLDTGHVMREMAAAGVDITEMQPPPARVVAKVKGQLPQVREAAKQAMREGTPPTEALRELARAPRHLESVPDSPPLPDGRGKGLVKCPACAGEGKVARPLAGKLRAWIKSLG